MTCSCERDKEEEQCYDDQVISGRSEEGEEEIEELVYRQWKSY